MKQSGVARSTDEHAIETAPSARGEEDFLSRSSDSAYGVIDGAAGDAEASSIGLFVVGGRTVLVRRHGSDAVWLDVAASVEGGEARPLAVIRHRRGEAPIVTFSPLDPQWIIPHSRLARDIVRAAIAIARVSQPRVAASASIACVP